MPLLRNAYSKLTETFFRLTLVRVRVGCLQSRLYGAIPGGVELNSESVYIFTLSSGDDVKMTAIQEFIDTKLTAEFAAAAAGSSSSAHDDGKAAIAHLD